MSVDELVESWIANAINEKYIQLFECKEFENITECAEGGLARIECADWKCSERKVALKKLKVFEVQKFVQEVKMHVSCHWSRNVVRFFGLIKEQPISGYTMVMEYADFKSLRNFLKSEEGVEWEIKCKLSLDIVKGLKCLHSRNIAHRDLHTDNIVIKRVHTETSCCQQKFIAQITDFGSATLIDNKENKNAVDVNGGFGQIPFTEPNYLDKIKRDYKRDGISDIYSLGVIFWEISSGKFPFEGYLPKLEKRHVYLSLAIINGKREEVIPSTPTLYSSLYQRCWDQQRDKRPTIDNIIKDLEEQIEQIYCKLKDNNNIQNINDVQNTNESNDSVQESNNDVQNINEPNDSFQESNNSTGELNTSLNISNLDINNYPLQPEVVIIQ